MQATLVNVSYAADVVADLSLDWHEVPSISGKNLLTLNLTTRLSWLGYLREVIQWLAGRIAASVRVAIRLEKMRQSLACQYAFIETKFKVV